MNWRLRRPVRFQSEGTLTRALLRDYGRGHRISRYGYRDETKGGDAQSERRPEFTIEVVCGGVLGDVLLPSAYWLCGLHRAGPGASHHRQVRLRPGQRAAVCHLGPASRPCFEFGRSKLQTSTFPQRRTASLELT